MQTKLADRALVVLHHMRDIVVLVEGREAFDDR